jgi:hypothetical protein
MTANRRRHDFTLLPRNEKGRPKPYFRFQTTFWRIFQNADGSGLKKRFRGLLGLRQIAFKLSDISLPILTDKTR